MADHVKITRDPTDVSTKVTASTLGAAVGTIGVWAFEATTSVDVPTPVEIAVAVVATFALGYLVRDRVPADTPTNPRV